MKDNILVLTISILLVTGSANAAEIYNQSGNKLDIYGRIYALNYLNAGSGYDADGEGDKTTFRLGIQGETQLTEEFIGYGRFEYQPASHYSTDLLSDNSTSDDETRYAYVGFSFGEWGSFDYGRNDGAVSTPLIYTDVLPEFGGNSSSADRYMTSRADSLATYYNADFFGLVAGLDFAIQYQNANPGLNGDGYSFTIEYSIDHFSAAAAYSNSATGADNKPNLYIDGMPNPYGQNGGARAEMSAFAVRYGSQDLYLTAMYSQSYNMTYGNGFSDDYQDNPANGDKTRNKVQTYELVALYTFYFENGSFLTPSFAYLQGKDKSPNAGSNNDLFKYFDLAVSYHLNDNMTALIDWKINRVEDQSDTIAIGLVYSF